MRIAAKNRTVEERPPLTLQSFPPPPAMRIQIHQFPPCKTLPSSHSPLYQQQSPVLHCFFLQVAMEPSCIKVYFLEKKNVKQAYIDTTTHVTYLELTATLLLHVSTRVDKHFTNSHLSDKYCSIIFLLLHRGLRFSHVYGHFNFFLAKSIPLCLWVMRGGG